MSNLSVRDYRNMASLTQSAVAEFLGITLSSYCVKEQGKRQFTIAEYKAMKQLFNMALSNKGIQMQRDITIDDLVG